MKKYKILCLSLSILAGTISNFSMPILPEASAATKRRSITPTWSRAIKIPHRAWIPNRKQKPTTVLICIHGLGFNSNSFADFGKRFASIGIAAYAAVSSMSPSFS